MTTHDDVSDEDNETPELPPGVEKIGNALRALGIDPDGGGAIERPAIAAGRLLGIAEILARNVICTSEDKEGLELLDDLMHGWYGIVVAIADDIPPGASSALRGALLEDRLRRAAMQADSVVGGEGDRLGFALGQALGEAAQLRAQSGLL
jgi:hypothetical protein